MMKPTRGWILAALPLMLTACGTDDDAYVADGTVMTDDPAATTAPPPAAGGMDASSPVTVDMGAVGGSGVTGRMELMAHGDGQTMVNVTLNAPAGASSTHSGHIHEGTCDAPGAVVVPLQDITLSGGTGMASSTVDVPASAAMNGNHIVAYHERAGSDPGAPVVCGAIPQHGGTASM
jgi:hypothetical protein